MTRSRFLLIAVAALTSSGWAACGGNISNDVCEPAKLVGKEPAAVKACYGEPLKVAKCTRPGCAPTEERWFYTEVWSQRDGNNMPPFACVTVDNGVVTGFLYDSVICEIGSTEQVPNPP